MAKKLKSSINSGKKPTDVAKNATTKTESFDIEDDLVMYLYDAGDNRDKYVRMDFSDYYNFDHFCMILDVKKLKGIADFIYKYLENK